MIFSPPPLVRSDYVSALSIADRSLACWLQRDQAKGSLLLSPRLKKSLGKDGLFTYLCGTSNPHHAAYSISRSSKSIPGGYAFNVRLYEEITDAKQPASEPSSGLLVVKRFTINGKPQWLVDKIP